VTDVYPAREEPVEGVTGKLVVDALADLRPGMLVAWTPSVAEGARFLASHVRAGDRVVTIGAGDVDGAVGILLETLR
jgi:UDP-N-acetylmuramate--alanine ligase